MGKQKTTSISTRDTSKPRKADVSNEAQNTPKMNTVIVEMAWQVAVSFMLLVLGGNYIDSRFETRPIFTIIGLFLGVAAVYLIVSRLVKNNFPSPKNKEKK